MWADGLPLIDVRHAADWRDWLRANHGTSPGAWFTFYKARTGIPTLSYGEAVDEAVCFGWIDNLMRSIDEDRYARRFVPRKATGNWSPGNVARVERLLAEGRMAPAGLTVVEEARRAGRWPGR